MNTLVLRMPKQSSQNLLKMQCILQPLFVDNILCETTFLQFFFFFRFSLKYYTWLTNLHKCDALHFYTIIIIHIISIKGAFFQLNHSKNKLMRLQ